MRRRLSTEDARVSRLWWLLIAAWSVLLLGLGVWSAGRSPATVREQRDIVAAKRVTDTVVARLTGGLPAGWHAFDEGYREEVCEVSVVRDGVAATRTVSLSGPTGTESGLISHLASGLDGAVLRPGSGAPQGFFYDAGEFVAVRGRVTAPGAAVVELKTGCRPAR